MPRVVKRSASQAVKTGSVAPRCPPSAVGPSAAFPAGREASLGPQWVHEIKLDGYRMAARIDNGRCAAPDPNRSEVAKSPAAA